ncbi:hypothetical protein C5167_005268 [Papaver somniferum]|uniref:F-box/LRR-repeat protein 15/At3g58940/PEG3-like LRR domain-containing protein n=1 Tax=Papaver somniferum TaxID=3469 RepID=A0A4Y7J9Z9_PAPSO|nr:hypothetical protein C5167_005268 [Papaver somniferum]
MRPKMFMDIVDKILHLHDMSKIDKFCLDYSDYLRPSKVNLWIYAAIKRNIEKFDLTLVQEGGGPIHIPLSLFTCESLITLKLDICTRMYLPKYISCPRLKHLQLCEVDFSDKYNSEQLFSNCPVLEELVLQDCDWWGMRNFCISAPALKILKIWGVIDHSRWYNPYRLQGCALKVDAPNLVSLSYKCGLAKEYVASSFQTLVDADLDFNFVKYACDATRRVLSCAEDLKNHLPTFHHLKQLNAEREASTDEALIALLKSAPNLESLVLNEARAQNF